MTTPNIPLLREVADWIRANVAYAPTAFARHNSVREDPEPAPDLIWDQNDWASEIFGAECKTACCVAGYVTLTDPAVDAKRTLGMGVVILRKRRDSSPALYYADHAQKRLGLSYYQATRLFQAGNDPDRVLELLSEYAGEDL